MKYIVNWRNKGEEIIVGGYLLAENEDARDTITAEMKTKDYKVWWESEASHPQYKAIWNN